MSGDKSVMEHRDVRARFGVLGAISPWVIEMGAIGRLMLEEAP